MVLTPFMANRFIEKHRQRYFIPSSLHHFIPHLRETPPHPTIPHFVTHTVFNKEQCAMLYLSTPYKVMNNYRFHFVCIT